MLRVVLDTDVIVAALRSPAGASAELLRLVALGHLRIMASTALMIEYEAVCTRPQHQREAGYTRQQVTQYLDGLAALIEPIETHFLWRPRLNDPDDEMVLEVAINGYADCIVTFNIADFVNAAGEFAIDIIRPGDALQRIRT
jgi:putative PIN family toxin of toxin-antitoxin system